MPRVAEVRIGPASSTGSPMTFMMRPSVSSPTGTAIGAPVSVTAASAPASAASEAGGTEPAFLAGWPGDTRLAYALSGYYRGELLGVFGVAAGNWNVPPLRAIDVTVVLVYFVLGYFFYAAMYAAVGAMCNSIQETQQYALIVTVFILVGFFAVFALLHVGNDLRKPEYPHRDGNEVDAIGQLWDIERVAGHA